MPQTNNQPIKLGIVGCGHITLRKHLAVIRNIPELEVVALADIDAANLKIAGDRYGVTRRCATYQDLLATPGLTAVGVCVPPEDHVEIASAAIERGMHTLVEKPLALSLKACDTLIDVANGSDRSVLVAFHMRKHRLIEQAKKIIDSGALGRIEAIRSTWHSPIQFDEPLPPWRYRRERGGGSIMEIGVHHFDLWRYLLGDEVEEVFAFSKYDDAVDETSIVNARLSSGCIATAILSERTSHEIEIEVCGRDARLIISCLRYDGLEMHVLGSSPGTLPMRAAEIKRSLAELPAGLAGMKTGGDYMESYERNWRHFADTILGRAAVGCTLADGRKAVEIALAAAQSASSRRAIQIAGLVDSLPPIDASYSASPKVEQCPA